MLPVFGKNMQHIGHSPMVKESRGPEPLDDNDHSC